MSKVRPVIKAWGVAAAAVLALVLFAGDLSAQALSPEVLKAFSFRAVGPSRQSGRFTDIAVPELEPWTIYAATGSGGLWKSVNNGQTWESIFDNQPVISIGDVAVSASNPNVVYVGTGEANSSRSTYWGDGVYKSTDGGKTWTNVGLKDTQHIGRMVIHPKNPDIVYVAALGHLYSDNDERGVFKTVDGGKTWTKSLDVKADGKVIGASDIVMDPKKPEILYAATYDKERKPWTFNLGGPGSAIYKTVDAGKTWTKLTTGLPGGMLGRIGIDISLKNPLVLYANIENANKPNVSDADRLKELREGKSSAGMIGEEVYRTDDGGKTWKKVSADKQRIGGGPGYYYMDIRVDPNDVNHAYVLTVGVLESKDGDTEALPGAQPMKFDYTRVHETVFRRVSGPFYLGVGYHLDLHTNIEDERLNLAAVPPAVTSHYAYSVFEGFDDTHYSLSGLSLNALWETRDHTLNPYRGVYLQLGVRVNPTWLGSSRPSSSVYGDEPNLPKVESRVGRVPWIRPYTDERVRELGGGDPRPLDKETGQKDGGEKDMHEVVVPGDLEPFGPDQEPAERKAEEHDQGDEACQVEDQGIELVKAPLEEPYLQQRLGKVCLGHDQEGADEQEDETPEKERVGDPGPRHAQDLQLTDEILHQPADAPDADDHQRAGEACQGTQRHLPTNMSTTFHFYLLKDGRALPHR